MKRVWTLLACLIAGTSVLLSTGCRPRLVVRLATVVYDDGSLARRLELRGLTDEGEHPTEEDWLAETIGVRLAEPGAWEHVDLEPGRLRAEGFFSSAAELPATFSFVTTDEKARDSGLDTQVTIDSRVVLKRWVYVERHADPYSRTDVNAAIDAITEIVARGLREELQRHFGAGFDSGPAEKLLWSEGRSLTRSLFSVGRQSPGIERYEGRAGLWSEVISQHGAPVFTVESDEDALDFWDGQLPLLLAWARDRLAAELSTNERPVTPEELSFWPAGEDYEQTAMEAVERIWGGEEALYEELEPHIAALTGYYGRGDGPSFRFESRVELPGVLLRTNGTPDGDGVIWMLRETDLGFGEMVLRAEAVDPLVEPLRRLGARRTFDRATLLRLADLLWTRDPDGQIAETLARAVERGTLDLLRDGEKVPDEIELLVIELADLLDPEIRLPEPL